MQLLGLVLSAIVSGTNVDKAEVSEMYMSDLPNPHHLDIEYDRWMRKWQPETDKPDALQPALQVRTQFVLFKVPLGYQMTASLITLSFYQKACDSDIFPNIHLLLRIACTIPVTSADNERPNSTLKLVNGYLRTTMTTERLSGPALMSIHYEKAVDHDAVVQKFAEQQPRRMLFVDPIFEES